MMGSVGMKEVMILRELEQIKAISQEYRISILETFDYKPCTAKMISDRLGENQLSHKNISKSRYS